MRGSPDATSDTSVQVRALTILSQEPTNKCISCSISVHNSFRGQSLSREGSDLTIGGCNNWVSSLGDDDKSAFAAILLIKSI